MTDQIIDLIEAVMPGPRGEAGPQGEQGLPGVNAVPADTAVAAYVTGPSDTAAALDDKYLRTDNADTAVATLVTGPSDTAAALDDKYLRTDNADTAVATLVTGPSDTAAALDDKYLRTDNGQCTRAKASYAAQIGLMAQLMHGAELFEHWDAGGNQRWTVHQASGGSDGPLGIIKSMPASATKIDSSYYATRDLPSHGSDRGDDCIRIRADIAYDGSISKTSRGAGFMMLGVCFGDDPTSMTNSVGYGIKFVNTNQAVGRYVGDQAAPGGTWNDLATTPAETGVYTVSLEIGASHIHASITMAGNTGVEWTDTYDMGGRVPKKVLIWVPEKSDTPAAYMYGVSVTTGSYRVPSDYQDRVGTWDTIAGTRRKTISTQVAHTACSVNPATTDHRLLLPAYTSRGCAPPPLLLYMHGNGQTAASIRQANLMDRITTAALQDGYAVASHDLGGNSWGNDTGLSLLRQFVTDLLTQYAVGPIILIGESMGGCVALNALARDIVPATAFIGIYPACNLAQLYNHNAALQSAIKTAYGITDNGQYQVQTAGHDPLLIDPKRYGAIPSLITASPTDTTVLKTQNADKLVERMRAAGSDVTYAITSGNHGDASNFDWDIWKPFLDRICL